MRVYPLLERYFRLDGGAMHGVVPRVLWEKKHVPDNRGRIRLAARPMLILEHDRGILIDGGIGIAYDSKFIDIFGIEEGPGLLGELQRIGVSPDRITDVVVTHLHFDHVGGLWDRDRNFIPERAVIHVQKSHWEWACHPSAKDSASFVKWQIEKLHTSNLLLHDGPYDMSGAVSIIPLDGHTRGLQAVIVKDGNDEIVYPSDTIPTRAHLNLPWAMAYDNEPLTVLSDKEAIIKRVRENAGRLFLEHEPHEPWVEASELK